MTIETNRLFLRPFIERDAEDVFEYLKEPAVNCFASMKLEWILRSSQAVAGLIMIIMWWMSAPRGDAK